MLDQTIRANMLSLSITTGYAIKALRCLEGDGCRPQITQIARCAGVPRPYLAKIIHSLSQSGLVFTKRGYRGGIRLAKPPQSISLLDVVVAVEGERWMGNCLLGLQGCRNQGECPTLKFWRRIRNEIEQELVRLTLADLIPARHGNVHASPRRCCRISSSGPAAAPVPPSANAVGSLGARGRKLEPRTKHKKTRKK